MFRNTSSSNRATKRERVIVDGQIIDVAQLRAEAKSAGTRFWVLLLIVSIVSSMVVPYLSMASIVPNDTKVFTGEVIPGYSMGGMPIAAYGVDINSWGQSAKPTSTDPGIVKSQYGYWTETRVQDATKNLQASQRADKGDENADLYGYDVTDEAMSDSDKAKGWIGITRSGGKGPGLSDFDDDGVGRADSSRKSFSESVAPYRTQADWRYWDSLPVGGTSPTITATVYPDFVIFGWDAENKTARTLTNPDDIQNATTGAAATGALEGTAAVPHYVPLSTLFQEFGLGDSVMASDGRTMNSLDTLFDAIVQDARDHDGKSPILNRIVENKSNDPTYDLLIGTKYKNLNGSNKASESASDAWNPYPYSMVFKTASSDDKDTVVSSIYNNTEAYVYFSPRSAYNTYMQLRAEYDSLVNVSAKQVAEAQPQAAFQLGYYLAGMSILEAYLNEALPQDMTRGYVGPAENNPIASASASLSDAKKLDTRGSTKGSTPVLFAQMLASVNGMVSGGVKSDGAVGFRAVPYSQLMYDFADAAIVKYGASGSGTWLGATSAIMNTLSTYGYGVRETGSDVKNVNVAKTSAGQGPNRGMTRRQAMARITAFGPYTRDASSLNVTVSPDGSDDPLLHPSLSNVANTGMYIPVYYPIQQHEMPIDSEMPYRFQIVSLIPYSTLTYELGRNGFNGNVTLSYSNNAVATLDPTRNYYSKVAALAKQLDDLNSGSADSLGSFNKGKSIALNPQNESTVMVGEKGTVAYNEERDTTDRVDNALMAFTTGLMNADNVHDLVDVMRSVPGVKYETFVRYYNPIKSSGGATDMFLTRVTPAQTAYMPSVLTSGYESAGGVTNNESIANTNRTDFDYFSIPSFGPCFAARTAEDTYYGALNYELRPFYTEGFLSSLPADTNVPALEQFEEYKDDDEEEITNAITGMKTKILTIYILAKRLAFATAYSKLSDAQGGRDGYVSAGGLYYADTTQTSIATASEATDQEVRMGLRPTDPKAYTLPVNDDGSKGFTQSKSDGALPDSAETHGDGDNRIDSETLSDGTVYGRSADGSQVTVDGDTFTVERDANGTVTHVSGGTDADTDRVRTAEEQKRSDEERERQISEYEQYGFPPIIGASLLSSSSTTVGMSSGDRLQQEADELAAAQAAMQKAYGKMKQIENVFKPMKSAAPTVVSQYRVSQASLGDFTETRYSDGSVTRTYDNHYYGGKSKTTSSGASASNIAAALPVQFMRSLSLIFSPTTAYAAPSSEANQIYVNDKLADRGYDKATSAEWSELVKSTKVTDGINFHIPSSIDLPASGEFDYVMQEFGQKHILPDDTLDKQVVWCKTSSGLAFVTDVRTILAALYNDAYTHFLTAEKGDSYYWDAPSLISKYDVTIDRSMNAKGGEKTDYNTVAMRYSDAKDPDKAKDELDAYCEKAFEEMDVMMENLRMLNDRLPKQMQNVIAWADVQGASESEQTYMTDPSDNVLHIDLGVKEVGDNSTNTLHNLSDGLRMGFLPYDNGGDYALGRPDLPETTDASNSERQARVVRGVAGTTATASVHLGGYTITSTIARIDRLAPSSASSSSIPYSGIYTGNLNQGTDRYAQLQAHTIDRQAVAAGLSGDLRSRGTSSVMVSTASAQTSAKTQKFVQSQAVLVNELQASVIPQSIDVMESAMAQTMPAGVDGSDGIADVNAATRGLDFSGLFGGGDAGYALANASTFGSATMNRQSAAGLVYNASSRRTSYQSGMATASASDITRNRTWATSLITENETFSDAYATIQSIALIMVLVFLMIIAFQNFVGYTSGSESDYITAQTQLKTVLPRALIAVAMIGLPPIGGGLGFQGGCYLLLQIISALVDAVVGSFTGGTDMFGLLMGQVAETFETGDWGIVHIVTHLGDILLKLLASVIFLIASVFVVCLCLATDVVLFLFWFIGPIVWAFYVWPYSGKDGAADGAHGKGLKRLLGNATGYMGLKSFTKGEVGRDAPTGWAMGYVSTLATVAIWSVMFWVFAIVLTMLTDGAGVEEATDTVRALADEVYDPGSVSDVVAGGAFNPLPDGGMGMLILSLLFVGVVYIMFRVLKSTMGGALGFMYGTVGFAAKAIGSFATGHIAAAAKGADLASKAGAFTQAKGMGDSVLGKAINVGARGADMAAHGIGRVAELPGSAGARDIGSRVNKMIDNAMLDVQDRKDSSGAFDGVIGTRAVTDEDGNVKGYEMTFAPAIQGAVDGGRKLADRHRRRKVEDHKESIRKKCFDLMADDNDWRCLDCSNRLAHRMADLGLPAAGKAASDIAEGDVSAFADSVKSRLGSYGSLSSQEREQLRGDAKLLGIVGDDYHKMASGQASDIDGKLSAATARTMEVLSTANKVRSEGRETDARLRHERTKNRIATLEAAATSIDAEFGQALAKQNEGVRQQGAVSAANRRAQSGMVTVSAVNAKVKERQNIKEDSSIPNSFESIEESKRLKSFKELDKAASGAIAAADRSDAELGLLAADLGNDDAAALARLQEKMSAD